MGFRCVVCGPGSGRFIDQRALKRHYRDREAHSALDLLKNGVRLWAFEGVTDEDKEVMQNFYEESGDIVDKNYKEPSEYECPSE